MDLMKILISSTQVVPKGFMHLNSSTYSVIVKIIFWKKSFISLLKAVLGLDDKISPKALAY